jgi:toxin secretion/phage lysis holin
MITKPLSANFTWLGLLTFSLATPLQFVEQYLFSDWEFLKFLLILITIDTVLGMVLGWKSRKLSSSRFAKLFVKMIVYLTFLVLVHILAHFTVEGEKNNLFNWFSSIAYAGIMVRESLSILENLSGINPNLLPTWAIDRLKNIDKSGPEPTA